jgi:predicted nucleotidyltransferase
MYKKVNITENHLRILALFANGFDREYYIREVQKILRISPRTAQLILDDLEKKAVLESKIRGKIKSYKLQKNETARNYLVLAEQYKKITFLEEHPMIKEIVSKITQYIQGIACIFGSYVKGNATKESDLDIFIAGDYDPRKIKEISKTYGIDISIKKYPLKSFQEGIRKDILVKEVLNSHIVFLNAENLVEEATNG